MRLCPICDKKLEGSWCKNCHRFVKGYEISEGIYFNERHDPKKDKDCTYHMDGREHESLHGNTPVAHPAYTSTQTVMRPSVSQTQTGTQRETNSGKKAGKVVRAIIIINVIITCIGAIGPVITRGIRDFTNELTDGLRESLDDSYFKPDEEKEQGVIDTENLRDTLDKIAELKKIEPVDSNEGEDYKFFYYAPEDIRLLGLSCSEEHFAVSCDEFESWLIRNWVDSYEVKEENSPYYNYYYEDEEYVWLSFLSFRDYYDTDDFAVRAGYDTGTGELHSFGFVSVVEQDYSELYYAALKEFDPQTEWTGEMFRENLNEALAKEENVFFYLSDMLSIYLEVKEGLFSLTFYPPYEE